MEKTTQFVITISRQLGCGGAYLGQQLAEKMNIFYADREIIRKAAKQLSTLEEDLELRDEKVFSFWNSFFQTTTFIPDVYIPQKMMTPTDRELFEAETEVIEHIVKERSAVIIGRCGFHIFREYPNHVSIFLHGDIAFRNERIKKQYNVSKEVAGKMIAQNDKERALYCKTFTGKDWADARNYDICIDTSKVDIDKTVELILNYLKLTQK
ncbi:MAG: cytidylate kinase-like family protein [Bacteroidales bacterium]